MKKYLPVKEILKNLISPLLLYILVAVALWMFALPILENSIFDEKKQQLISVSKISESLIFDYYERFKSGEISEEEAQERVKNRLNEVRYGQEGKDYVWILSTNGTVLMHPYLKSLVDENINHGITDDKVKTLQEMIDIATSQKSGFIEYNWEYYDSDEEKSKISHMILFEPWGWIIGTGVYVNDAEEYIAGVSAYANTGFILFGVLILVITLIISYSNIKNLKKISKVNEELFRSYSNLNITLNSIGDAVIATDRNGNVTQMNPVAEKLCGWTLSDAKGKNLSEILKLVNYDTREFVANPVEKVLENGQIVGLANHTTLISKDGNEYQIADSAAPIKNDTGDIFGVVLVFSDVSEAYALQNEIKQQEEHFRTLADSGQALIWTTDTEMKCDYFNKPWLNFTGRKIEDELGDGWIDGVHPDDLKRCIEIFSTSFDKREKFSMEYRIKHNSGEYRWILDDGTPRYNLNNEFIGYIGHCLDISYRKSAEENIIESEEKHRFLFENMSQGVVYHSPDRSIIYANKSAARILGLSQEQLLGKKSTDPRWSALHEDGSDFPGETHPSMLTFDTGKPVYNKKMKVYIPEKDDYHWININSFPKFKKGTSEIEQVVVTFEDITEIKNIEQRLDNSLDLMRYIIEHTRSSVAVHDANMNYVYVSQRYYDDLRLSDKDITGRNHYDVFPDLPQELRDVHQRALKGEVISGESDMLVHKDGSVDWANWQCRPWYNADGTIGGIIIYIEVKTKQKIAEDALKESEARYKALHNASFGGITIHDKGLIIECNQGLSEITGYSFDELIGMDGLLLIAEKSRDFVMNQILSGYEEPYEAFGVRKSGEEYPLRLEARNIPYQGKQVRVVEFRDITEQKRAEEALKENLEMLNNLSDQVPGVVYQYRLYPDGSSAFPYSSVGMYEIYEVTSEEVKEDASPVFTRLHPDDYDKVSEAILESAKNQSMFHCEFRVILPKQGIRWRESNAKPFLLEDGSTLWYGIISDITERKQAEKLLQEQKQEIEAQYEEYMQLNEELQKTNYNLELAKNIAESSEIELQHKNEEYSAINEELKQTNEALISTNYDLELAKEKAEESDWLKSAFLMNMSHEIRTPMNAILGFLDLLNEPELDEESRQEYIDIANKSGLRLIDTINDIIEISKIESGQAKVVISQVNTQEIMQYQLDVFKLQTKEKGLNFVISGQIEGVSANIETDQLKLECILTNLIKNAIKFTDTGQIEFGNYLLDEKLIFYVKDTGRGIPEDRKEAIFERFVQADMSISRGYEGSGLGLSIVKAYVEALNGKIWLESEVDKGTAFYFSIPYYHSVINEIKNEEKKITAVGNTQLKLLIAEDDITSYLFFEKIFHKENVELINTTNGLETINALKNNPDISLILMDLKMPKMDGLEATKEIRKFNKNIPIIAQTAYALLGDKEKALEAGCNDYISKPIKREDLINMIRKYIDK